TGKEPFVMLLRTNIDADKNTSGVEVKGKKRDHPGSAATSLTPLHPFGSSYTVSPAPAPLPTSISAPSPPT
ncbi:hypothetical protein BJ165DRAFT_1517882, partial [Panaeolus papilionaceus]